jgi:plastocyanin
MISIEAANFTVANNPGQPNTEGQGHVHFFLDAIPPITSGVPARSAPGTYVEIAATSYVWPNVSPGLHVFSAELVNNDHTPLTVPAVASVMVVLSSSTAVTTPAITMMSANITQPGASPTPTITPTATVSPTMTVSPTATLSPTATVPPTVTVSPTDTVLPTITVSPTITASPTSTLSPTATMSPSPGAQGVSVTISVQVSNFGLVAKQGQTNVTGEGHLHYFLDSVPPTFAGQVAVTQAGSFVVSTNTTHTWQGVAPGVHLFSVELVNNDHTPLNPPLVMLTTLTVLPETGASPTPTPTATLTPTPTVSPTATFSPTVTPTATLTPTPTTTVSPSPTGTITPSPTTGATGIDLVAQNLAFDTQTIMVPAGSQVTISFDNRDQGVPHNFSVYTNSNMTEMIFQGNIITGPALTTYNFNAPDTPGTYFFVCDVHPFTMNGQFIVQ